MSGDRRDLPRRLHARGECYLVGGSGHDPCPACDGAIERWAAGLAGEAEPLPAVPDLLQAGHGLDLAAAMRAAALYMADVWRPYGPRADANRRAAARRLAAALADGRRWV